MPVYLIRTVQPIYLIFLHPTQGVTIIRKDKTVVAFPPATTFKMWKSPSEFRIDYRGEAMMSVVDGERIPITEEGLEIFREEEAYKQEVTEISDLSEWEYIDVFGH